MNEGTKRRVHMGCSRRSKEGLADGSQVGWVERCGRPESPDHTGHGKTLAIFHSVEHNKLLEGLKQYELRPIKALMNHFALARWN